MRWLPTTVNRVVSFGFSASARFGRPADFGGGCPGGAVLLSSPAFQNFSGDADICVETTPTANDAWLQAQAAQYFQQLTNDPNNPRAALSGLRDAVEATAQLLLTGVVCRTDENSNVTLCVTNVGGISIPGTGLGHVPCPVPPNPAVLAGCLGRGNQTPFGCEVIACVEMLNAFGPVACTQMVQGGVSALFPNMSTFWTYAGAATFCALIAERDHYYTVPGSGAVELCSTSDSRCTRSFVMQKLLEDVRRQAPFVLDGRPNGPFAAPPLSSVRPIDVNNPSKFYYLGFPSTNTSNPITISVPSGPTFPVVNTADQDHILEGVVDNTIFEENGVIKVRAVGHGNNTRFGLLNDLVGPHAIKTTQKALKKAMDDALPPLPPPPPPPPDCRQMVSGYCAASCDGSWDFEGCYEQCLFINCGY